MRALDCPSYVHPDALYALCSRACVGATWGISWRDLPHDSEDQRLDVTRTVQLHAGKAHLELPNADIAAQDDRYDRTVIPAPLAEGHHVPSFASSSRMRVR